METSIGQITANEFLGMLKAITGFDFNFDRNIPEGAIYGLHALGISLQNNPQIEWIIKNRNGILIVSTPLTKQVYWQIPEDIQISDMERQQAEDQICNDYQYFLESIEQAVYITSERYAVNIKLEKGNEPRLYAFLSNSKSEDYLVNCITAINDLLPDLLLTA